jgi:hypothetical protein
MSVFGPLVVVVSLLCVASFFLLVALWLTGESEN